MLNSVSPRTPVAAAVRLPLNRPMMEEEKLGAGEAAEASETAKGSRCSGETRGCWGLGAARGSLVAAAWHGEA
eukprot:SAG11_NODE_9168_length_915_cov_0.750299_1_plen_72_part_10